MRRGDDEPIFPGFHLSGLPRFFGSGKFVMVNWTTADVWVVVQFGQGMESADNETQQIEFVIFPRIRFKI